MKGYFLNLFILVLITCCTNPSIDRADIETAGPLPAALEKAEKLGFIVKEGLRSDTIYFIHNTKDHFRTHETGILLHHRVLEWRSAAGDVFSYRLYSSLPAKYGGEGLSDAPNNIAEIYFNEYFCLFSNDDILKANDSIPAVVPSLEIEGAGETAELKFDKLGINELSFIGKGVHLKRIE